MRGKLVSWVVWLGLTWNIPAYAGKTGKPERVLTHQEGTSPRMRGKRILLRFFFLNLRNIPAYAGKTLVTRGANYGSREHPRVCGKTRGQ